MSASADTERGLVRRVGALLALLLLSLASPAIAETPVERHGQLRVEGNRIVGHHGRPAVLRGMSLFWSQWMGGFYNEHVVRWLVDDWRIDVIRVAVAVEPDGYLRHPEREWRKAERVIDAAIAAGIYVIVDWHAHRPHPVAAGDFFERLAQRYGHHPNLIYEIWNEPLPEHGWAEVVKPYHEALIPRIRRHDPDNLIVAGTPTWTQDVDVAAADPLPFANVAYALHFYAGSHRQALRDKAQAALDAGAALMVTEWGTTNADGDGQVDEAESRLWWDFMAANHLSDLNWSINDKAESSAALGPGASRRGGWRESELTPSGRLVRRRLRDARRLGGLSRSVSPPPLLHRSITAIWPGHFSRSRELNEDEPAQRGDHRPRRSRQDDPCRPAVPPVRHLPRQSARGGAGDGFERPRERARDHHPRQVHQRGVDAGRP